MCRPLITVSCLLLFRRASMGLFLLLGCVPAFPAVQVYVAYAENERPAIFFPDPWYGSPNTTFLGYPGPAYDSGGVLIVNTGITNVVLSPGATVDGFRNGMAYKLWDNLITPRGLTIAPGKQVILAQTMAQPENNPASPYSAASCTRGGANTCYSNFDTSDTPVGASADQTPATNAPVIHLTLDGVAQSYVDTGQVLNTGGFDFGNTIQRNESMQWRLVGTTGPLFPGGSGVAPPPVTTWHNDNARTGLGSRETTLRPDNVNGTTFGKLFSNSVDGNIYGQPLFVPNVTIPGRGIHNVVVVATENNSIYAFDAESNGANGGLLWGPVSLGNPVPTAEICGDNIHPSFGVTGTPVIDVVTGTIYVVSMEKVVGPGRYVSRLHALSVSSGTEKLGGPTVIQGSVAGNGDGAIAGRVAFYPGQQLQRPALLLAGGSVYIAFGSNCDLHGAHGWLFGYHAANIASQTAIYNTTPNATSSQNTPATPGSSVLINPACPGINNPGWGGWLPAGGAIWMAGAGPAADGTGIFAATGNGHFDANAPGGRDFGDSIVKLTQSGASPTLTVADFFAPHDQLALECNDDDLGAGGSLLLPGTSPALLVQTSKQGTIYLVNRATGSMGKYNAACGPVSASCDHVVQVLPSAIGAEVSSSPAYFNGAVYFQGSNDPLKEYRLANGHFTPATPVAQSTGIFNQAATPSISYNSNAMTPAATGIVWSIDHPSSGQAVLHAYTADNLRELYNTASQGVRDTIGATPNFTVPTVAAGKVFVATSNQLIVYGGGFFTSWSGETTLGGLGQQIAVSKNQDGRLEVFYVGTDNRIYHNYQVTPNAGWNGEVALGGFAKQIAVAQNQDGRLEIFYVGTDNKIYHNYQVTPNAGWNGEVALGGLAKQIAVAQNQDGRLEIFYVGTDNKIYHNYQVTPNAGWNGEVALGGLAQQITAAKNQDGRLEIFYVGTDNKIYHNYQITPNAGWNGEVALGGLAKQIAAAPNQDGRLEVFYVGTNDLIYHNYQVAPNSDWSGESPLGGFAKQVAALRNPDGRLEVFYVGTDSRIYHNYQIAPNSAWNGEMFLGGAAKQLAVETNQDGRLEVFYVGTNNVLYHNYQTAPNNRWNH
jgi:hypothetical protein